MTRLQALVPATIVAALSFLAAGALAAPVPGLGGYVLNINGVYTDTTGFVQFSDCSTGAAEPAVTCATPDNRTSLSFNDATPLSSVSAAADISAGTLAVSAATEANGAAQFLDSVQFNVPGLQNGQMTSVVFTIAVSGTLSQDDTLARLQFSASSDRFSNRDTLGDRLQFQAVYNGPGSAANPGSFSVSDIGSSSNPPEGDFTQLGPSVFSGSLDIWGDSPTARVTMNLFGGSGDGGTLAFSNTAGLSVLLPEGATIGSSSGVFLDEATTVVPLPPAAWLFLSALAGLGLYARRRQAKTSR